MLLGFLHSRVLILLCSFLLVIQSSFAQIGALEDSVFIYRSATIKARSDSDRLANNDTVKFYLAKCLRETNAFEHPFTKLKNFSVKNLPDKKTRIITWNVELEDYTQRFFGYVIRRSKGAPQVFELNNALNVTTDWEKKTSEASNWLGAIYLDVVPAGIKNTYLLLGWRGKDRLVSHKVIDVLYFENGEPHFGMPIIQHGKSEKYRVIFTYPAEIPFALDYNKEEKQIVFSRMGPIKAEYAGNYSFYSPTSDFDAYKLEKKKWILIQDVSANMPERVIKAPQQAPGSKQP